MEIKFLTDDRIRRIFVVFDTFNGLKKGINKADRRVFPSSICDLYDKTRKKQFSWQPIIDGSDEELNGLIDATNIPLEHNDESIKRIKTRIMEDFTKYGTQSAYWTKNIFGWEMPKELYIILDLVEMNGGHGLGISSEPPLIALQMAQTDNNEYWWSVIMHEIWHVLMKQSGAENSGSDRNEAIFDYFAPVGIFDVKIGMLPSIDIDKLHRKQVGNRPLSQEDSDKLLPLIKEYYKICGEKTIWDFLKEKGSTV